MDQKIDTKNPTENPECFTDSTNAVKMEKRAMNAELIEPAMLLVVLIIGFVIIICDEFNAVASLIYIAPCVVSSLSRTLKTDSNSPSFWIHLCAAFISTLEMAVILIYGYKSKSSVYLNVTLLIYPLYEALYIAIQKTNIDSRR